MEALPTGSINNTMNRNIILFSLLLLTPLFLQCGKLKLNPNAFYSSDFPMTLGSYWEYERAIPINRDSNYIKVDTIKLIVTEEDISIGEENGLWKLEWQDKEGNVIESLAAKFNSRKIIYYSVTPNGRLVYQMNQYNFPMKKGDKWEADVYQSTYHVLDDQFLSSDFGKDYGEGFLIYKESRTGAGIIYDSSLVVKDIGLVYRSVRDGASHSYQLITYEIKE
jgi:hypothetical protein